MADSRRPAITKLPNWTTDEFKILLSADGMPAADLVESLHGRTPSAISAVQQGVHAYHIGNDTPMLSTFMVDYLRSHHGSITCPVCGRRF